MIVFNDIDKMSFKSVVQLYFGSPKSCYIGNVKYFLQYEYFYIFGGVKSLDVIF